MYWAVFILLKSVLFALCCLPCPFLPNKEAKVHFFYATATP